MAASMGEIFPVSIRKLFGFISPSQIHHALYSVNEGVVVCVLEQGDVIAVCIKAGIARGKSQRILQQVHRIYLSVDDQTNNGSKQETELIALNKDCSLSLHHLSEQQGQLQTDVIAQCTTDELQAVVKDTSLETSNINIIGTEANKVYVLIAEFLVEVVLDGSKTSSFPISRASKLQWNPSEGKVIHGKTQNGLVVLLHATGNITIHLLSSSQTIGSINWTDYFHAIYPAFHTDELKSAKPAYVDITPDLQYLIITFHETKHSILKISLNEYFQLFLSHRHDQEQSPMQRHHSVSGKGAAVLDEDEVDVIRGRSPVDQMGAPGNRSWRNLLTSAKEMVNKKSRSAERTNSIWKLVEESEKNKNWFDSIHELQPLSKQQMSTVLHKTKRAFQQDSQVTTALKKRKTSKGHPMWSQSTTLNISEDDSTKASYIFKIPKAYRDKLVGGVSSNASSVLVWYKSKTETPHLGQRHGGLCIIDVETNSLNTHNFTECTVLAGSDKFNHPPLLISTSDVLVLACDAHQETLVNMLMIYKSASVAETLCLQNSWDHCSIPIHALEVGLQHRQLDTVAFFLKSRENVFHVRQPTSSPASSPTQKQPTAASVSSDLTQLWLAVDLLMSSIRDNIKEPQSRQYSMQLLHLTLGYQTRLIQNAVEGIASRQGASMECIGPSEEELNESLRKLISCVAELRLYLKECPMWLRKEQPPGPTDETDGPEDDRPVLEDICPQDTISKWNSMSPQDVIKEAILDRRLPLLQAYLRQSNTSSVEPTGHTKLPGQMSGLIQTGLDVVLEGLLVMDLETAREMLQNMGYNVNAELKKICLFTANSTLRNFLIDHLSQLGEFSPEEEEAIAFIKQLERLYACQSFEKAKSLAVERDEGAWSDQSVPSIPANTVAQEFLATTVKTGELVSCEASNCENFNYAHILLDWVKHWDQETRERILIEKLLSAKNKDTPIQFSISQDSMWNYLTVHSEWAYIEQWIQASFPLSDQPSAVVGWNQALPQILTPEAADQLKQCTDYLRERILNELARRGVFSSAEFSNLKRLVYRLGSNCLLFSKPSAIPTMQQEGGMSTVHQFNQQFMEYCMKEQLPNVLYLFLDYYKLCQSENDVINMQLPFVNGQWMEMMLHFRWVARQVTDPSLMFQASLSNGRLLLRVAQPSVTSLLEANQPVVALATLMYAPGTLSQAMTQPTSAEDKQWKVLPLSLKHSLKSYPKLQAAIFSPQDTDGIGSQDITVYQLLQGNAAFDPAKLFQWQPTNNTAPKSGKLSEMQHFSQPDLVRQFAYHEDFKFSYYLYQGRPSFAFVAFLASQLREDVTISRRRISNAHFKAYTTALRHFTNHSIAAACVAFVEMLGRDSLPMRIDLQAANTVMNSEEKHARHGTDNKAKVEERLVSDLMLILKGSRSNAELVADRLSSAISAKLKQERMVQYSWEASDTWVLAILYSRLHKLPLPTAYLNQCALNNQWLHFTCFAQAHQYPKDQVLEIVKKFESATVREHLRDAFENLQFGSGGDGGRHRSQKGWARDVRSQYYLKMGVVRSRSSSSRGSVSESSDVSEDSTANVSEDYASLDESFLQDDAPKELDISKVSQDLFAIIFSCNSTAESWKSLVAHSVLLRQPVLAVIASCYQDSQIVDCLATWLLTSMSDQSAVSKVTEHIPSLQWHSWSLLELREVITAAVETGDITLLVKGFFTFDPDCTLNHLLSFCECFTVKKNFVLARQHLKDFHADMLKCRRQESLKNIQDPYSSPGKIQGELEWCQETACHIVEIMFAMCQTNWDTGKLLQLLADGDFSLIISRPEPNYNKLHKICQMLQDTNIQMNIKALLKTKAHLFKEECQRVAEVLQQGKLFSKAKEFSELCGLPSDQVVVNQLHCDLAETKKSRVWSIESGRITFWRSCHTTFKKNQVQGRAAHKFFMSQVSSTATPTAQEMVTLLTFAHQWLAKYLSVSNQSEEETRELQNLEHKVWQWKLKAEVEKTESPICYSALFGDTITSNKSDQMSDEMFKPQGASELLYVASHDPISSQTPKLTDEKEISALDRILTQLLEHGCIIQAHRLATQFCHPFQDLSIILTCIQLALGKIRPLNLSAEMQSLLKVSKPQLSSRLAQKADVPRRTLTKSMSSLSISSFSLDQSYADEGQVDEVLDTMQDLSQQCTSNTKCCSRIINAYAIAQVLQRTYEAVVTCPPFDILKAILISASDQRFALAKIFIRTNGLKDTEVAGFLSDIVITGLQMRGGRRREALAHRPSVILEVSSDRDEFSYMIRLCKDPAILGNRLLDEVNQLASSDIAQNKQVLTMQVDLIIRAHDCHTLCCNTEGICSILRVCRDCSAILQQAQEFTHLARLLIGVGRYSEMTYIFDTLRAHQQIEMLLRRGTKDDKLKVALLDYLKRCDPPDTETYNAVAVKFEMNREIGELVEKDARQNLKSLSKKVMDTNIELQNSLQAVLQDFTKAAQHYAKDNCLRHAERCVKQARLVALQLHLLPTRKRVINLEPKDVADFVAQHPKFYEAHIVSSAYRFQTEWSISVYNNVVEQGDVRYFEDFRACMPVSESIFRDVATRFKRDSSKSSQAAVNMKSLLGCCQDVLMAYKLATELGFQDVARELLEGEAGAYIRDVA